MRKTVHTGGRRETTYFLYDGHRLSAEIDAAGTLTRQYLYLGTLPLALLEGGRLHWLHPDALGTPQAVTGEEGQTVWRQRMAPFGQAAPEHDPDRDGSPFVLHLRFPGQYFDQETGLHYNGHRYYNPHTGRYTGADPIGLNGGTNLYTYAALNPINAADPNGLDVTIAITRDAYTSVSITGTLSVTSTISDLVFSGYFLEQRTLDNTNLPVPPGTYTAFRRLDRTPNRVELSDVIGALNVQIHTGNTVDDVEGCFAAGTSRSQDYVGGSINAMNEINAILDADGGDIIVVIVGGTNQ